jgi:RHS repeat-associated protein
VNGESPIQFVYDDDDLLIQAGALTLVPDSDNGLLTSTSISAGTDTIADTFDYSEFAELEHYTANYNGTPIFETDYTRDSLGRITDLTETVTLPGGSPETKVRHYEYDQAGRLYRVCSDPTCTPATTILAEYHYDQNGNRIPPSFNSQGTLLSATYDDQDRLLETQPSVLGTQSFTYTENGDLETKTDSSGTTAYTYDALGNLRQVVLRQGESNELLIEYLIDGRNRRIGKKVDDTLVRQWVYQDQLNPVAELDGSGALIAQYVYGTKPNVPDYLIRYDDPQPGQTTTYRIVSDHLGSVRLVVDIDSGFVAQELEYDEFGVVQGINLEWQPFGFAGGIYDGLTGLVRFGVRDYAPDIGRWTAKDPIGFGGRSANLYGYVAAEPVNRTDPEGKALSVAETSGSFTLNAVVATIKTLFTACIANFVSTALGFESFVDLPLLNTACSVRSSDPDCTRATPFHLAKAHILGGEEAFKREYVGNEGGLYDICACKDRSIRLARVGKCGSPGPKIATHATW